MIFRLLLLSGVLLLVGFGPPEPPPKPPSPAQAEKEGRALVADLLSRQPGQNVINTGMLKITKRPAIPVKFEITATETNWSSIYETATGTNDVKLTVVHADELPNEYRFTGQGQERILGGNGTMIPFAGSDFWVADLGLEFFHWPMQRLVKKEMRRSRSCDVLESINPNPAPGAYSRVVSWIDIESGGIVFAEAYDFRNRRLKEFAPKDFKKVNGQWQLEDMQIDNDQTGSRTRIEFHLGKE